jgi:hypothetical protein
MPASYNQWTMAAFGRLFCCAELGRLIIWNYLGGVDSVKRWLLGAMCLIVLTCGGCHRHQALEPVENLDPQAAGVHPSVQLFWEAEDMGYGQGEYFAAKLLRCVRVEFGERISYYYRIAICPLTEQSLCCLNIRILPSAGLESYFLKRAYRGKRIYGNGGYEPAGNIFMGIKNLDPTESFPGDIGELAAYSLEFTWNNVQNGLMEELGVSVQDYDRGMTDLQIQVQFNGKVDRIPLTLLGTPEIAVSVDDPVAQEIIFVRRIFEYGGGGSITYFYGEEEKK